MTRLRRPATKRFSLPPMIWFNRSALSGGAALVRGLAEVRLNDIAAAAMMDRLVHHADVNAFRGDFHSLEHHDLGRRPNPADGRP